MLTRTAVVEKLAEPLASVRYRRGGLIGQMKGLGFRLQQEAVLETLTKDVLKTSEIEGEKLDAEQVRSSVAQKTLEADNRCQVLFLTQQLRRAGVVRYDVDFEKRSVSYGCNDEEYVEAYPAVEIG
ncbi:MAG TPA: DUF4172 domain-containing protein [Bryobacteraceae bacterium]|nr:DUF4172 domain-containing protein [Bryobacteraceae bacterium]HUO29775.1 DUF4172 domain-containing protein [Bryobacteraceae bacterium]